MENFIFSYLSANFYLEKSNVGNYGIYLLPHKEYAVPVRGYKLISEIASVFCISESKAKKYINRWVKPADLNFYWKTGKNPLINWDEIDGAIGFPTIRSIAATTIAGDLVQVTPLSAPRTQLLYVDYQYSGNTGIHWTTDIG